MAKPSPYDAIAREIRRRIAVNERVTPTDIASAIDVPRPTVSAMMNHGTPARGGRPGRPPLRELFATELAAGAVALALIERDAAADRVRRADALRDRLLGLAVYAADRVRAVLANPEATPQALDGAAKVIGSLASVIDRLVPGRAAAGKDKSGLRSEPDAPPAPAPTAEPTEAEVRAQLDAVALSLDAEAGEGEEPGPGDDSVTPNAEVPPGKAAA